VRDGESDDGGRGCGRAGGVRRRQGHRRRVESRISVGRRRWHQGSRLGFLGLSGGATTGELRRPPGVEG
jgi:hypothetical protein